MNVAEVTTIDNTILVGDVLEKLKELPDESIDCCVTSPPYWGLRDYGTAKWEGGSEGCDHSAAKEKSRYDYSLDSSPIQDGDRKGTDAPKWKNICPSCGARKVDAQIGLEKTPEEYVAKLVAVFREVRRVLKKEGTLWLNLGDSYSGSMSTDKAIVNMESLSGKSGGQTEGYRKEPRGNVQGLKPKDLVGIPWAVAKALQTPFYTGQIKNEKDRVWLAAMIDAEGTICGFTHKRRDNDEIRNGIHITVTNSNVALLDNCFRIWPTTREEHNQHGDGHFGNLPTWRWIVHGIEQKSQLLAELYPYLIGKKKQALLAWNFLEISKVTRGRNKGNEGQSNREKYTWIVNALSRLNHLESVDIPSWCKEPPIMYEEGFYLRQDIIWAKPNPMPESVTDRPTKAHEYIFLLAKSQHYFFDQEAVREKASGTYEWSEQPYKCGDLRIHHNTSGAKMVSEVGNRNIRSVWTITTQPYPEAHFATFPEALPERCIKAGTSLKGVCPKCGKAWERVTEQETRYDHTTTQPGKSKLGPYAAQTGDGEGTHDIRHGVYSDVKTLGWQPTCKCNKPPIPAIVLDPFCGSGTTLKVAQDLGRRWLGIELKPDYVTLAYKRIRSGATPLTTFSSDVPAKHAHIPA